LCSSYIDDIIAAANQTNDGISNRESIQRASKTDHMQLLMTLQSSNVSDTFETPVGGRTFLTNMKMAFSELSLMHFRMT
jgi:hypothetical protein